MTSRRYNEQDLGEVKERFFAERSKSLDWLKGLEKADFAMRHTASFGVITAGDMFASWVAHDNLAIRQLGGTAPCKVGADHQAIQDRLRWRLVVHHAYCASCAAHPEDLSVQRGFPGRPGTISGECPAGSCRSPPARDTPGCPPPRASAVPCRSARRIAHHGAGR